MSGPSVRRLVTLVFLRIVNDSDSAGRGGKRDEKEGATKKENKFCQLIDASF